MIRIINKNQTWNIFLISMLSILVTTIVISTGFYLCCLEIGVWWMVLQNLLFSILFLILLVFNSYNLRKVEVVCKSSFSNNFITVYIFFEVLVESTFYFGFLIGQPQFYIFVLIFKLGITPFIFYKFIMLEFNLKPLCNKIVLTFYLITSKIWGLMFVAKLPILFLHLVALFIFYFAHLLKELGRNELVFKRPFFSIEKRNLIYESIIFSNMVLISISIVLPAKLVLIYIAVSSFLQLKLLYFLEKSKFEEGDLTYNLYLTLLNGNPVLIFNLIKIYFIGILSQSCTIAFFSIIISSLILFWVSLKLLFEDLKNIKDLSILDKKIVLKPLMIFLFLLISVIALKNGLTASEILESFLLEKLEEDLRVEKERLDKIEKARIELLERLKNLKEQENKKEKVLLKGENIEATIETLNNVVIFLLSVVAFLVVKLFFEGPKGWSSLYFIENPVNCFEFFREEGCITLFCNEVFLVYSLEILTTIYIISVVNSFIKIILKNKNNITTYGKYENNKFIDTQTLKLNRKNKLHIDLIVFPTIILLIPIYSFYISSHNFEVLYQESETLSKMFCILEIVTLQWDWIKTFKFLSIPKFIIKHIFNVKEFNMDLSLVNKNKKLTVINFLVANNTFLSKFENCLTLGEVLLEIKEICFIPLSFPIIIRTTSKDVNHAIGSLDLGLKIDSMSDRVVENKLTIFGEQGIEFDISCYEYCGEAHYKMNFPIYLIKNNNISLLNKVFMVYL